MYQDYVYKIEINLFEINQTIFIKFREKIYRI